MAAFGARWERGLKLGRTGGPVRDLRHRSGRVAGPVAARFIVGCGAHALQSPGEDHVFQQELTDFIHIRGDLVGGDSLPGQAHANVAAELTDPHRSAIVAQWRHPDTQVIPFVDAGAAPLQGLRSLPARSL